MIINEGDNVGTVSNIKEENKNTENKKGCNLCGLGMAFVILSSLFYSINSVFVKMLHDLHPLQTTLSRVSVQFLLLLPLLMYKRNEVDILGKEGLKKFLWLRGIGGGAGLICLYTSINYLPVADAVTITYSKMIMVPLIARVLLKEKLELPEIGLAIFSLVGVVLVAQPSFIFPSTLTGNNSSNLLGVMYALLAAALQGATVVIIRKLGKTYPPLNVAYYSICGAVITVVLATVGQHEFTYPCYDELPMVFSLGLIGVVGQSFLTLGLQRVRAGTVVVLQSSQLVFVYVLQVLILGTIPSWLSIVGSSILLISGIILGIRKGRKNASSKSK